MLGPSAFPYDTLVNKRQRTQVRRTGKESQYLNFLIVTEPDQLPTTIHKGSREYMHFKTYGVSRIEHSIMTEPLRL